MNISQVATDNNIVYDRYLYDNLELPYEINEILIQPNETVSASVINLKFNYINENFLYLYKNSLISSNIIPVSNTAIAGITANSTLFTWYYNLSTSQFIPLSTNTNLEGLDNVNLMYILQNKTTGFYYMFLSYSTQVKVLKFNLDGTYLQSVFNFSEIDPGYSQGTGYGIGYKSISAFAAIDRYFYILDSERCQLVKYDAIGFITKNNIFNEKLSYVDSIGNFGGKTSKLEFNNPTGLAVYQKFIYVLDSGNSCVKKYDSDLNWVYTYRLSIDLLNITALDIACDKEGNVFILTNKSLLKYNNSFTSKEEIDLTSYAGETFKKIVISTTNENIFYLVSNKNVYKKFTNRISPNIGKYLLYRYNYNIPSDDITAFATISDGVNDNVLLFTKNGNTGKLGLFKDNLNLYDILAQRDFDIYTLENIKINGQEYFQNWCINKSLAKIILNHMRFRDQIIGKFQAKNDINNNIIFSNTRYLLPEELDSIYFQQELTAFIGANEVVTTSVINRCIRYILNAQINMLKVLQAEILGIPYFDNTITLS